MNEKEVLAYMGLRNPETRKDNVSPEYYMGFMNGRLSIVEEFRDMFEKAILHLRRLEIEEQTHKDAHST